MPSLAKTAREFDCQLQEWYDDLPAPIRSRDDEIPSDELPCSVRARILELRSWVCRQFLYYLMHSPLDAPHRDIALPFAETELRRCLAAHQSWPTLLHRHHGTFYAMLSAISHALLVLGAVKSGRLPVPLEWKAPLLFIMEHIRFREDECPRIALTQLSTYAAIFFNTFVNPIALEDIGWKYYIVFSCILVVVLLTIYFAYPETKGHSLEDMAVIFDGEAAAVTDAGDITMMEKTNISHVEAREA